MAVFQPPPTWALPILTDEKTGETQFNPVWLNWFVELAASLGPSGAGSVSAVTASAPLASSGGVAPNLSVPSTTGSGSTVVLQNTPTLTTPNIGAATGTSATLTEHVTLAEMTAPAGVSNKARVFAQDNGAGKTQLMVIFGSGAAQQIAIEP